MLVPKAAPYLDDFPQGGKDEIGFTGQLRYMEPVAESHSVHEPTDSQFRRSMLRPDVAHVSGATLRRKFVGHTAKSKGRSEMSFNRLPSVIILTMLTLSSAPSF